MVTNRKLADLGSAVDSAATGNFLTVDDSGGKFRSIAYSEIASRPTVLDSAAAQAIIDSSYIQARQTDVGLDSSQITSLVDSSYITARQSATGLDSAGALNLVDSAYLSARSTSGLDSSKVTNLIDSDYISGKAAVNSGFKTFTYFASDGQTDFSGSDYNGEVLSYTADGIIVWLNGVQILDTDDYTASNGTSVALTAGADSGASLVVGSWALGGSGSSGGVFYGDRAFMGDGTSGTPADGQVDYFDITTTSNAADFGDYQSTSTNTINHSCSVSNATNIVFYEQSTNAGSSNAWTTISVITCATIGNASDFGDQYHYRYGSGGASNGVTGMFAGGWGRPGSAGSDPSGPLDEIDYVTIATAGNAADWGSTLSSGRYGMTNAGISNADKAVYVGGAIGAPSYAAQDTIETFTWTVGSSATDFGDLTTGILDHACAQSTTRGLIAGGTSGTLSNAYNTIEYITIASPGNATDFGDLTTNKSRNAGCSNTTRAVFGGGFSASPINEVNVIEYVTIATTGNAQDFGDLTTVKDRCFADTGNAA